ncbi:hypothetical protein HDU93_001382 [Gonapodya sp. JEL0774]|nr:hypothetical protein HDU93_001382 [Gonapodya sp. JEL0774]
MQTLASIKRIVRSTVTDIDRVVLRERGIAPLLSVAGGIEPKFSRRPNVDSSNEDQSGNFEIIQRLINERLKREMTIEEANEEIVNGSITGDQNSRPESTLPYLSVSNWPPAAGGAQQDVTVVSDTIGCWLKQHRDSDRDEGAKVDAVANAEDMEARLELLVEEAMMIYDDMMSRLTRLNTLCSTLDRACDEAANNVGPEWVYSKPLFGPSGPIESRVLPMSRTGPSSPVQGREPMASAPRPAAYSYTTSPEARAKGSPTNTPSDGGGDLGTWTLHRILKDMFTQDILLRRTIIMCATNDLRLINGLSRNLAEEEDSGLLFSHRLAMTLLASWRHRPYIDDVVVSEWDELVDELERL